jgi:hypothetical protein
MDHNQYLKTTPILDFEHPDIDRLVRARDWDVLNHRDKIGAAYGFVKDEIAFGYNSRDDLPASRVLRDGYGQCNTKGSLFMALLRRLGLACRFHGFTIDNTLQKGAIPWYVFWLSPKYIIHSWVEVWFENRWVNLEGFIIDREFLKAVQQRFPRVNGSFCGYGIATTCLGDPPVEWNGTDTYIQKEGIHDDYGVFPDPDTFYQQQGTNLSGLKKLLFSLMVRHLMNLNVKTIRHSHGRNTRP